MSLSRRIFVGWSAMASAAIAALPFLRARAQTGRAAAAPRELKGLELARLLPVAHLVLPQELGNVRLERATVAFSRWIAGYKAGEETLHPYGSDRLGSTGASPAQSWVMQLDALDKAAGALDPHSHPFALTTLDIKRKVLTEALTAAQLPSRVPPPLAAPHVAIAILSHFLDSADGKNLAYGRVLNEKTCRPLSASPIAPVALQRNGRGA